MNPTENSTNLTPIPTQAETGRREALITRIFDAPRDLVFKAWTDPKHVQQWWGPRMFTNPVCELDARTGGDILIHMQGPDGTVYPMKGTFNEVIENERLVFTSTAGENEQGTPWIEALNTVTFEDEGSKTKMTLHVVVKRAAPDAKQALEGMDEGWNQSFDKLAELLA